MTACTRAFAVALGLGAGLLGGCGLQVAPPARGGSEAEFPIPETVKTLGIIVFSDTSAVPYPGGEQVAGELFMALGKPAGPYNVWRYDWAFDHVVQEPLTSEQACRRARAIGAEAVVYGTTRVEIAMTSSGDPENPRASRSEGRGAAVTCRVTVRFMLDEVATGRTIASVVLRRDASAPGGGAGAGGELARTLLRQCVKEFVAMINSKPGNFSVALDAGTDMMMMPSGGLAVFGHGMVRMCRPAAGAGPRQRIMNNCCHGRGAGAIMV